MIILWLTLFTLLTFRIWITFYFFLLHLLAFLWRRFRTLTKLFFARTFNFFFRLTLTWRRWTRFINFFLLLLAFWWLGFGTLTGWFFYTFNSLSLSSNYFFRFTLTLRRWMRATVWITITIWLLFVNLITKKIFFSFFYLFFFIYNLYVFKLIYWTYINLIPFCSHLLFKQFFLLLLIISN